MGIGNSDRQVKRSDSPTVQDVVQVLRERFSTRYQESYDHAKRQFEQVLKDQFDMGTGDARRFLDDLEKAQVLRFIGEVRDYEQPAPRIGLLDEPGEEPRSGPHREFAGRHWRIGQDQDY
jgi:hypothetical protein